MKKTLKKILGYAIGLGILVYLFYSVRFDWSKLLYLSFRDILILSIASLVLLVLNGISLRPQLAIFSFDVPGLESFFISQFYNLLNYLPLKAGIIGEGVQLKVRYGFPYKKFISANVLTYGMNFFLYAIIALVLLSFFPFASIFPFAKPIYFILFLALIAASFLIFVLLPRKFAARAGISIFFEDRDVILKSKKKILIVFIILLFGLLVNAFRLLVLFYLFGYPLTIASALMMSILASFSFLIGFTPGGIGIRESFMGGLSFLIFHDAGVGVAVSMVTRIFDFLGAVVLGGYGFHFLKKAGFFNKNTNNEEKIGKIF